MAFDWAKFRDEQIRLYSSVPGNNPCPSSGKYGEDYGNQCAMRVSTSLLTSGFRFDTAKGAAISPNGFFSYANECNVVHPDSSITGMKVARGAANLAAYLWRHGGAASKTKYVKKAAPSTLSGAIKSFSINGGNPGTTISVDTIAAGATPTEAGKYQSLKYSDVSGLTNVRGLNIADAYKAAFDSNGDGTINGTEATDSVTVFENTWMRMVRLVASGKQSNLRGIVHYYEDVASGQDRGFHIDGFDIDYYISSGHIAPVLGNDFLNSVDGVEIFFY